ncbi:MAG: hypothetical protein RL266_2266 [Bacteroidota bacterium]|jgi:glycosyltransferase involved in cell wall biosynthesis
MKLSIIIPCFQNETQLPDTVSRIVSSTGKLAGVESQIILIDDQSKDGTWKTIKRLAEKHPNVSGYQLERNIGAYNAILIGMEQVSGSHILVMAADGDDPPELIPEMTRLMTGNVDAVLADRVQSEKRFATKLASNLFWAVLKSVGAKNLTSGGSDFMLVRRELVEKCTRQGWKSGNTLIQLIQHARETRTVGYTKGRSKPTTWTFIKKAKLFLQTVNQFVRIPFVKSQAERSSVSNTC